MTHRQTRLLALLAIALAGPTAFGLDLVARRFVIGVQPEDVRRFMAEHVTRLAWYVVPLPLVGGIVGFFLYRTLRRQGLARARAGASTSSPEAERRAELSALLVATSAAQIPAFLGDLSVMLGARLTPALCTTGLSVLSVVCLAALAEAAGE